MSDVHCSDHHAIIHCLYFRGVGHNMVHIIVHVCICTAHLQSLSEV